MSDLTRRQLLGTIAAAPFVGMLERQATAGEAAEPLPAARNTVPLTWLDNQPPAVAQGVSWGVPWPHGMVQRDETFALSAAGEPLPMQSWLMAYWPDGSIKWTGHATGAAAGQAGPFLLEVGPPAADHPVPLRITENAENIEIINGGTRYLLNKHGANLVESITMAGRVVARAGKLVLMTADRADANARRAPDVHYTSQLETVTLEQSGPIRAVVKFQGKHKADGGERQWLPFCVRLYFFAGVESVKMVHSFVFDGDQEVDFISGMGVRFSVPFRQEAHNRHVRFAGEPAGVFAEPVRIIIGRRSPGEELYAQQLAGRPLARLADLPGAQNVRQLAIWDEFKLNQHTADSFTIEKRTGAHSAWIHPNPGAGKRSQGTAFLGDATGGLALGVKKFWQMPPKALNVKGASTGEGELTVWLWSPDVAPMDLRHYDIVAHGLEASYEDIDPGFSTAHGIARTHELSFCPFTAVPSNADLVKFAQAFSETPRLICSPQTYHAANIFGVWSVSDKSTPRKRQIEDGLEATIDFLNNEVDNRRWYGFWDYGDIMHTFDRGRHTWEYDIGGFAWMNTELMPDLFFWYMFLRTGRPDYFRLAEAMTRHTQEVDSYHIGRFVGLGSRHNVRHWGCGAKEARISQSLLKRFYYYVTTDERTGDLMREVLDADQAIVRTDPLRKLNIGPAAPFPTHMRSGPDWTAVAGNWMAEWERTGDTRWRDRIEAGMRSIIAIPRGLQSALDFAYDPRDYTLHPIARGSAPTHFLFIFGGAEFFMELRSLIQMPAWESVFLDVLSTWPTRNMATDRAALYAAHISRDEAALRRIAANMGRGAATRSRGPHLTGPDQPSPIDDSVLGSSGGTMQSALTIIQQLELAGRYL